MAKDFAPTARRALLFSVFCCCILLDRGNQTGAFTPERRRMIAIHDKLLLLAVDPVRRYVNITKEVEAFLGEAKIGHGHLTLQSKHTTCSIVVQEDETGLLTRDLPCVLEKLAPTSSDAESMMRENRGAYYAHDDRSIRVENLEEGGEERVNGHAHLRAMFIGQTAQTFIIKDGVLAFGTYQQILFFDFDDRGNPSAKKRTLLMRAVSLLDDKPSFWHVALPWFWRP